MSSDPTKTDPDMEAFRAEAEKAEPPASESVGAQAEAAPTEGPTSPEFMGAMFKMIFGTLAMRGGAHWVLKEAEAKQLGEAAAPIVDKYMPAFLNKYGAELAFAWTFGMVVYPRVVQTRVEAEKRGVTWRLFGWLSPKEA